jgi:hypothetical protein
MQRSAVMQPTVLHSHTRYATEYLGSPACAKRVNMFVGNLAQMEVLAYALSQLQLDCRWFQTHRRLRRVRVLPTVSERIDGTA